MAFTDEQNEQIRNDLIRAARRCGITIGMRKTSVEQLEEAVDTIRQKYGRTAIAFGNGEEGEALPEEEL